ncbi:MAG: CRISPR system precrRNA processing endoribonuclease RAMP protein Cas6 [Caldisericaceae bacterium]
MEIKLLSKLSFSEFLITFSLDEKAKLRSSLFPGAEIRGSLMLRSKHMFCANKQYFDNCELCPLRYKCQYALLFETPLPKKSTVMTRYDEIPHPFTMAVLHNKGTITTRFVLFGDYIGYFPYLYISLLETMKNKNASLIDATNFGKHILEGENIITEYSRKTANDMFYDYANPFGVSIDFISPMRIKYRNKLVNQTNFEFHHLIRNLLRRFSLLSYFYGGEKLDLDYNAIIKQAETVRLSDKDLNWLELERHSLRTNESTLLGGIVGNVVFDKGASDFMQILRLGHYIQVGKNTSFGHGYYELK